MVKSNVITITVVAPITITENTITVDKTTVVVGEIVTLTGALTFSSALLGDKTVRIDLYVNNVIQDSWTITAPKGATKATYSRQLQFSTAGTYSIFTDANFA
jgi:hypothetical protein